MTLAVAAKLSLTSLNQHMLQVMVTGKMTVMSQKPQESCLELQYKDRCECLKYIPCLVVLSARVVER